MHSNSGTAPATDLSSGRVLLGRYRIARQLARGGMGVVHLGRVEGAQGFAKPVVIKTILATGGENAQLFAREARIVSQLQHAGIVAVIDFGQVDDSHVMVLEYIHGYNLGQWFRYVKGARGQVPLPHALHVVLAVLDALAYAHGLTRSDGTPLGIVHRDISPGNILIDVQGRVKLADFGIARTADDEYQTQAHTFRGTLSFSPPEALNGTPVDGRGDEYACAIVLYLLLTGLNPFRGSETGHTVALIMKNEREPISSVRADVPPGIAAAIDKAMARDANDRFATVAEFAEALRRCISWSERDAARDFAAQIAQDFTGEMPEALGIEPLAARDAAWREGQETSDAARALPKGTPPSLPDAVTKTRTKPIGTATPALSPPELPRAEPPRPAPAAHERSRTWVWLVLAGAIVLSAGLLVVFLRPRSDGPPSAPIIVERQSVVEDTPPPAAAPPAEVAPVVADTRAPTSAAPASPQTAAKASAAAPRRTLAGAFQQRQGAIQGCFKQNPNAAVDTQHLSVRFDVDPSGRVSKASLSPASVAAQPLGSCILGVARSTNFGPQPEPISFSIPIAARMVQH